MAPKGISSEKSHKAKAKKPGRSESSAEPGEIREPVSAYDNPSVRHQSKLRVVSEIPGASILSLKQNAPESKMTSFQKIAMVQQGISKKSLEILKEKAFLDYDQLSDVLNVARATLINKKGNDRFGRDVSEKILSLATIYSYGYEVFEDQDRFNSWVFHPNQALGGKTPFEFLNNSFGREEVRNLIGRIEHGVYS